MPLNKHCESCEHRTPQVESTFSSAGTDYTDTMGPYWLCLTCEADMAEAYQLETRKLLATEPDASTDEAMNEVRDCVGYSALLKLAERYMARPNPGKVSTDKFLAHVSSFNANNPTLVETDIMWTLGTDAKVDYR